MRCSFSSSYGLGNGVCLMAACCGLSLVLADGAQQFELNEQQFNHWLYNSSEASFAPEAELAIAVEAVDRACDLTEAQKEKLRLAGHGDYSRFDQRVRELRAKFVGKTFAQEEIGNIYQQIQPLGAVYQAGLLGSESLFLKVLTSTLTPEQNEKFQMERVEQLQARSAAKVRLFVAMLERSCPLTHQQRSALVDLLLAEMHYPSRASQYDWYVVLWQASQIPDEKFAAILDEAQIRCLKQLRQQAAGMEHFLRQQKLLPEE